VAKINIYKNNGRYYGDFRSYKDVGGGQEALIPEGERFATKCKKTAKKLAKARRKELKQLRVADVDPDLQYLGPFVDYHMMEEALRGKRSKDELEQHAHRRIPRRARVSRDCRGWVAATSEIAAAGIDRVPFTLCGKAEDRPPPPAASRARAP
jgi:hypothetical protein